MARGGRVHWVGRAVVLGSLALPILREGRLSAEHAGLIVATIALLLTIGRLTLELNNLLRRARWDADHDGLTGVFSRNAFRRALERASTHASERAPLSLLLLDLDGFGSINKTAGHAAGDRLLAALGELLRSRAGEQGFAGRLGGDEFALVVPGTDAPALAGELLAELPQETGDGRRLSASIGIAQAPRDGGDGEALLRAGDIALRVAKRAPAEGQISAYSAGSLTGAGQESARGALRRAIDGDELTIVVQPIFDLRSGAVHAYEALARFGADGAGSPLQWLSLADELGERDALERACLRAALELFCRRPPNTSLSVNVSATVLLDRRTRKMLDRLPDLSGLIIEVTEDALVRSSAQLDAAIAPLRERGAKMAVDDMGAGYSGSRRSSPCIRATSSSTARSSRGSTPIAIARRWSARSSATPRASAACSSPRAWRRPPSCACSSSCACRSRRASTSGGPPSRGRRRAPRPARTSRPSRPHRPIAPRRSGSCSRGPSVSRPAAKAVCAFRRAPPGSASSTSSMKHHDHSSRGSIERMIGCSPEARACWRGGWASHRSSRLCRTPGRCAGAATARR